MFSFLHYADPEASRIIKLTWQKTNENVLSVEKLFDKIDSEEIGRKLEKKLYNVLM